MSHTWAGWKVGSPASVVRVQAYTWYDARSHVSRMLCCDLFDIVCSKEAIGAVPIDFTPTEGA